MSEIPGDLKFLKSHEWARIEDGGQVTVGISEHAQSLLGDLVYVDPAADEAAFHPPYNELDAISSGWIQTGKFYHSTADVDWGGVDFKQMEKLTRAHAFLIDELGQLSKADLKKGGYPVPSKSIYQSDLLKIKMGDN